MPCDTSCAACCYILEHKQRLRLLDSSHAASTKAIEPGVFHKEPNSSKDHNRTKMGESFRYDHKDGANRRNEDLDYTNQTRVEEQRLGKYNVFKQVKLVVEDGRAIFTDPDMVNTDEVGADGRAWSGEGKNTKVAVRPLKASRTMMGNAAFILERKVLMAATVKSARVGSTTKTLSDQSKKNDNVHIGLDKESLDGAVQVPNPDRDTSVSSGQAVSIPTTSYPHPDPVRGAAQRNEERVEPPLSLYVYFPPFLDSRDNNKTKTPAIEADEKESRTDCAVLSRDNSPLEIERLGQEPYQTLAQEEDNFKSKEREREFEPEDWVSHSNCEPDTIQVQPQVQFREQDGKMVRKHTTTSKKAKVAADTTSSTTQLPLGTPADREPSPESPLTAKRTRRGKAMNSEPRKLQPHNLEHGQLGDEEVEVWSAGKRVRKTTMREVMGNNPSYWKNTAKRAAPRTRQREK